MPKTRVTRNSQKRVASRQQSPIRNRRRDSDVSVRDNPPPSSSDNSGQIAQLVASIAQLTALQANQLANAHSRPIANYDAVPAFDPGNPDHLVTRWCDKVEELGIVFGWTQAMTINAALSKLTGHAKTWYEGLPSVNYTWEEWREKLIEAFPPTKDYHYLLTEMMARKKKPNEPYAQYYYEKLALLNACDIFEERAVSCIIGGIVDPVVVNSAKAGQYKTPEGLFTYLSTLPAVPSAFHKNPPPPPPQPHSYSQPKKNSFTCHKCGKTGHYARECQSSRVGVSKPPFTPNQSTSSSKWCNFCKRPNHVENDCFAKKKLLTSSTKAAPNKVQ